MKRRLSKAVPVADPVTLQRLRRQLRSWLPGRRAAAVERLGEFQDRESVPVLIRMLADGAPEVRREVIRALGRMGDASAAVPLSQIIEHGGFELEVRGAIHLLGAAAVPALYAELIRGGSDGERAAKALEAIGAPAVTALAEALRHADMSVRSDSVRSLGWIHDPRTAKLLIPMLNDPVALVRARAAEALGRLRAREAVPHLIALLKEPDAGIRLRAAWGLGEILDPGAIPALCRAIHDPAPGVVLQVAASLGVLMEKTVPEELSDFHPGPELRMVLPTLRRLLSTLDGEPRRDACRRLIQKIEALTRLSRDLPVPAAGAGLDPTDLPRPAAPAPPAADHLPIAADPVS